MKKPQLMLLLFLFLTLTLLGLFWQSRQPAGGIPVPSPTPPPTAESVPLLPITPLPGQSAGTAFTFALSPPIVPEALPVYALATGEEPLVIAKRLASVFGLSGEPAVAKELTSRFYTWRGAGSAPTLRGAPRPLSVRRGRPPPGGGPHAG